MEGIKKTIVTKFGIHLKVKDIYVSYSFYSKFNLNPIFCYGSEKWVDLIKKDCPNVGFAHENYNGVTFEIGGALFEIADGHVAVKEEVFKQDISSSKVSAMFDVESIEEILMICKIHGFDVVVGVKEYPWGTKEVVVRDPDGFILVFREFTKKNTSKVLKT